MKESRFVSVLIADDHPVVRKGLVSIINHEPGLQVVAEACCWTEAIKRIIVHRPDLAIADLRMPGMNAPDAIATIREKSPSTRIIVLTAFDGGEAVYQVLRAGAEGYLPKEAGNEVLGECIRAVLTGKSWIHPSAASQLADRMLAPNMTSRESEVLEFVAVGKTNKEIGQTLGVTEGTVKVHINHIFAKLGVNGRVAATLIALKRGIVHPAAAPASLHGRSVVRRPKVGKLGNTHL